MSESYSKLEYLKLTITTPQQRYCRLSGVFNFEKVYITFGGVSIVTWIKREQ